MSQITDQQILDLPMDVNDSGALTVRGYLVALLSTLWHEQEGFNSKRPFGNSGWDADLWMPLIKAGYVQATLDEDGYLDHISTEQERLADRLIAGAIQSLGTVVQP